ncbi:MAG: biotin/lipoyl-containing protein [Eubacteriales bacterium]|nr:biotin/lipoyl-containing protein [Eubacteriales bacterium]
MKYEIALNGRSYEVEVEVSRPMAMAEFAAYQPAAPAEPAVPAPAAPAAPAFTGDGEAIEAPMPGTILKTLVSTGDTVKSGDVLVILEAMKMENEIMAPRAGRVTQLAVSKGSTVDTGDLLLVLA